MKRLTLCMSLCTLMLGIYANAQTSLIKLPMEQLPSKLIVSKKTIEERTASFENYSTLSSILKSTHLDKVLAYDGEFTVFAPSNTAFKKLPKLTADKLLDPKNSKVLRDVLSYHIIAGNFSASSILRAMCRGNGVARFTTILGEKITATMNGIDIVLTDNAGNKATIVRADSTQSNGVIHEIDAVFLPIRIY
ncbi:fasciclin domain-containing protein [Maribacter sp. MAR_2009_72]|uniref:fasciclin domain-containing protein n=1 Tax=Maribacter sp. MAR_2009_72 TaxID=1250050 RepID=UPI001199BE8B|nr:fasciclin domain-containing protein [Maribacter sp. MAR_2009_72]TVZ14417.1 putative surface protein with fasciclin (FAS1) repeats [Maribacter sp. MAR_2009_72]